jgi:hypothetical protein
LNLECPGCHAHLKLDPAKLPPGAATAVCPKCRAKIPIPGAPAAADVSVQCGSCGARLKVNVARLKAGVSQSKCPKCGGVVALPAAPGAELRPAPVPAASAQTRRLDAREMALLLGGGGPAGAAPAGAPPAATPIAVEAPQESGDVDLGRLIEEKVESLTPPKVPRFVPPPATPPPRPAAAPAKPAEAPPPRVVGEPPAARPEPAPIPLASSQPAHPPPEGPGRAPAGPLSLPGAVEGPELSLSALRERAQRSAAEKAAARSDSGARPAPRLEQALGVSYTRPRRTAPTYFLAGVIAGAVVGGVLAATEALLPEFLRATTPEALAAMAGPRVAFVIAMIALSGGGAFLGGIAAPPERSEPGRAGSVSVFRVTVASGLVGLLAGIAFSLARGPFDLVGALLWLVLLSAAGLLAAPVASALLRRA